jgi:hypothetical protein
MDSSVLFFALRLGAGANVFNNENLTQLNSVSYNYYKCSISGLRLSMFFCVMVSKITKVLSYNR